MRLSMLQSNATIYLSSQRGCTQTDSFRSYHTFNFGAYENEARKPFKNLRGFNEDTLKGPSTQTYIATEHNLVFLLPFVGGVEYQIDDGEKQFINAGESALIPVPKTSVLSITNPYAYDLVNYFHAWFSCTEVTDSIRHTSFNPDIGKDRLKRISSGPDIDVYLGRFSRRMDCSLTPKLSAGVFAFVLEGVFEFQNRLLEQCDGLALWDVTEINFEALSQNALILIFEFSAYPEGITVNSSLGNNLSLKT
jgi:quercetin 2,3-dioxygenase